MFRLHCKSVPKNILGNNFKALLRFTLAVGRNCCSDENFLQKKSDIKRNCSIGQLGFRHQLIKFDLYEYYVHVLSSSYGYF